MAYLFRYPVVCLPRYLSGLISTCLPSKLNSVSNRVRGRYLVQRVDFSCTVGRITTNLLWVFL